MLLVLSTSDLNWSQLDRQFPLTVFTIGVRQDPEMQYFFLGKDWHTEDDFLLPGALGNQWIHQISLQREMMALLALQGLLYSLRVC